MKKVTGIPKTFAEALEMGFENRGGDCVTASEDQTQETGTMSLVHPDGTHLDVPYCASLTFATPKLNRACTRGAKDRLAHPEKYDSAGCLRRKGVIPFGSPLLMLGPEFTRIMLPGKVLDVSRKDGSVKEYAREIQA